jgi:hypothetical protein
VLDNTRRKTEAIPTGTLIEVRLNNNQKLRGRRGEVSQDSLILASALPVQSSPTVPGRTATDQKIAFTDVAPGTHWSEGAIRKSSEVSSLIAARGGQPTLTERS